MSEVVRILHCVHTMDRGGMESRIMDLYRHLDRSKYQYDFYVESGKHGAFEQEITELGGRLYYPDCQGNFGFPNTKSFQRFLAQHEEYKIVYAYNQWAGCYLRQAQRFNVPSRVAYSRTSIQTRSIKNNIKNIVKRNAGKYATHKFAVSKEAGAWLFGSDEVEKGNVRIWPNAIDTQKYAFQSKVRDEVRSELGLHDEMLVIHVGNIRFEKNHAFLLDIFANLKQDIPDAKLVLVGGGSIETLKEKIMSLGIENSILYLGVRKDVPRLLQAGDVFVFPSLYEGFPGAVLEAESSGLFCLISDSITPEVELSGWVRRHPLSAGAESWKNEILNRSNCKREDAWKVIRDTGYDINDVAKDTETLYYEMLR